jgi:hypothetical protein
MTHRAQENFPAQSPQRIGDIYQDYPKQNSEFVHMPGLAPESRPIEVSPGPKLNID